MTLVSFLFERENTDCLAAIERGAGKSEAFVAYLTALREALCRQSSEVSPTKTLMVYEDRGQRVFQRTDRLLTLVSEDKRLGVYLSERWKIFYYVELVSPPSAKEKVWGGLRKQVLGRLEPIDLWDWGILAELSFKIARTGGPFVIREDYPQDGRGGESRRKPARVVVGEPSINIWGDHVETIDESCLLFPHFLRRLITSRSQS
jgi:hypothetical protein